MEVSKPTPLETHLQALRGGLRQGKRGPSHCEGDRVHIAEEDHCSGVKYIQYEQHIDFTTKIRGLNCSKNCL